MASLKSILSYLLLFIANIPLLCYAKQEIHISPDKTIWYTHPAKDWSTQCLHIGNGYMGGSFYGEVEKECFNIAEKTFWTGGPNVTPHYNYGIIKGGKNEIGHIREAIIKGDITTADALARKHMMGNYEGFGYFSKVGELYIEFPNNGQPITDYIRGLDLEHALGFVQYKTGNIKYEREYLCSYPDRVMAFHFSSDTQGQINFTAYQKMTHKTVSVNVKNGNELVINGLIEGSGLKYCARIAILNKGGKISTEEGKLTVSGADHATVLYTVATEYNPQTPNFKGVNPQKETEEIMNRAISEEYYAIKAKHIQDYSNLFDRVSFSLVGDEKLEQLPTDKRIEQLKKGTTDDSALKSLYFNSGRYLIISASRPGTLPSNLQGVWNCFHAAPWQGNYQSNINLEEMYWACGPTNLPECQESYINWIQGLVEPGRKVAQEYYGTRGWVSHATGNIWKYVSPGTDLMWGLYPAGSAWHCRHLWDQFDFFRDLDYLKKTAYPIMKEAALFYLENLVPFQNEYIMIPSVAAEHGIEIKNEIPVPYTTVNGEVNENKRYLYPAFQDIEMIYDLFANVISASQYLNTDRAFREKIIAAKNKLAKLKTGKYGQLQEWLIDVDNPRDHHRHNSHLYALFPGNMINTPELRKAARISLNMRGEGFKGDRWPHTGGNWSAAWRIACWTRLSDGNRASDIFNLMVKESGYENMLSNQSNNTQVDACMATPALFSEMLLQSHDGWLHLLPALPAEWPEGEVKGLIARGGYKVNIQWKYGQLIRAEIFVPQEMGIPKLKLNGQKLTPDDNRVKIHYVNYAKYENDLNEEEKAEILKSGITHT